MNAAAKTNAFTDVNLEPVLRKVLLDAEREHSHVEQLFRLMGWGALPDALKLEIRADVQAMVDELNGQYSSCDPFVEKRRQRVCYWVDCYLGGVCSLQTAVDSLKVRPL